ncbi:MAG: rod shape-determining protein MreC [Desulfovibrionaceae bacterium]|nr:rod shape-determining protein MreC [Desulfovibrionaceae bacterium]
MKLKRIAVILLAGLFLYLTLYTWNLRTGHLDTFSAHTGLDFSGWVLRPGDWIADKAVGFWERYVYLVGLKQENDLLREDNRRLRLENMTLAERSRATVRLERLLRFAPPEGWAMEGARVVAHRMGPAGVLDTVLVDKGSGQGVSEDTPVVCAEGVVGSVMRAGLASSTVLLISDMNSRVAVVGLKNRAAGILAGQGWGRDLSVKYMKLNAALEPGEILVTSGLGGVFPKGLPVARVSGINRSDISLFLDVRAEPLMDADGLEEVLILRRLPAEKGPGD